MAGLLLARARNFVTQVIHPGRKVFIIGPHRCATTTLHMFLATHGLKSIHWRQGGQYLATEIESRLNDDGALHEFLSRWTVFSDFVYLGSDRFIENHTQFRRFEALFSDAYFVFNDRNVDRWISSRLRHRDGEWLRRYLELRGGTKEQAVELWRAEFLSHREDVLAHFRGRPNFLHFFVDGSESREVVGSTGIGDVIDLLGRHFTLLESQWRSYNTKRKPVS